MGSSIWWVMRDLRLSDNAALGAAAARGPVLAVFVIDAATMAQGAASRWRLERGLGALDTALRARTGQGLAVLRGEPEQVLPALARAIGAEAIHASAWPCPAMRAACARLRAVPDAPPLHLHPGHLLIHPARLRPGRDGEDGGPAPAPYRVHAPFARALRRIGPEPPCPAPARITAATAPRTGPDDPLGLSEAVEAVAPGAGPGLAPDLHGGAAVLARHALPAGEAAARDLLDGFLDRIGDYATGRDRMDLAAGSGLGEALALGEIGPRTVWAAVAERLAAGAIAPAGAERFLDELGWREFAWHLMIAFPDMATRPWRDGWARFAWRRDEPGLAAWTQGRTGIALVDAGLREMRVTGRMHNRARMIVANHLCKHLLGDWRLGLAHFADSLTDWDPAVNAMNWQWVAGCGPDAAPFFRVFNPLTQADRHDPGHAYRRRWLAGYQGSSAAPALDYFATLPRAWTVAREWQAMPGAREWLLERRRRALAAHEKLRCAERGPVPGRSEGECG